MQRLGSLRKKNFAPPIRLFIVVDLIFGHSTISLVLQKAEKNEYKRAVFRSFSNVDRQLSTLQSTTIPQTTHIFFLSFAMSAFKVRSLR